jgi:hypothetical protein
VDKVPIHFLSRTKDTNFYVLGRDDGQIQLKHADYVSQTLTYRPHDPNPRKGKIKKIILNPECSAILSIAQDGTFFSYQIDYAGVKKRGRREAVGDPVFSEISKVNNTAFSKEIPGSEKDIIDDTIYDIQQAKIRTEQDKREQEAAEK